MSEMNEDLFILYCKYWKHLLLLILNRHYGDQCQALSWALDT